MVLLAVGGAGGYRLANPWVFTIPERHGIPVRV
jgi:hypothetical protein